MKQIILPFNTGKPLLEEVPAPARHPGHVLIRTVASVVSPGTERMLLEFGKAGWLGKVQQQPEKVRQVLDKIKADGLGPAVSAVRRKLDQPVALGYSQAGVVIGLGDGIDDLRIGDRVASNGGHAEIVSAPRNLVARIPEGVPDEEAAFTVLGAIALQGIRLAQPTLGETVVVYGLGLIGQLTAQLLLANGCRVIGADLRADRLALAAGKGVAPLTAASGEAVRRLTGGHGADAVVITAASGSDEILAVAADMCRKRGRIVLTGVAPLTLNRDQFFKKELSFQVSSSYGPGRYEPRYENHGLDYPIGYVRWTEGRNFDAVLHAMKTGRLDAASLITARKRLDDFESVYASLSDPGSMATVFTYSGTPDSATRISLRPAAVMEPCGDIAIVGAGNFTASVLLPALKQCGASVEAIISRNGLSATTLAKKHNIPISGTAYDTILDAGNITALIITTPHDTHAAMTTAALRAGKHVLVEKPLALSRTELEEVAGAAGSSGGTVSVGFNRRFAPLALQGKALMTDAYGPMNIIITVNAGPIPRDHWIQDPAIGGGRILGEACHFIDLAAFFADSPIVAVCAGGVAAQDGMPPEDASILLRFANGSNAAVHYFSNGSKAYDKERVELYRGGWTVVIENWRLLHSHGFGRDIRNRARQDKGHAALIAAWVGAVKSGKAGPMPLESIINSTLATIAAAESLTQAGWISI
jgi:predicted dehydrogenase/threonine dehydrogenase-like Zn-dependent dehydrogenase